MALNAEHAQLKRNSNILDLYRVTRLSSSGQDERWEERELWVRDWRQKFAALLLFRSVMGKLTTTKIS